MKPRIFTLLQFVLLLTFSTSIFAQPVITKVGCSEYKAFYLCNDKKVYAALWDNTIHANRAYPLTINKDVIDLSGGLYHGLAVDADGYPWTFPNNSATATRIPTDANGNPFNGNVSCAAYFSTNITIRSDGTIWYWGSDDYNLVAGTAPVTLPVKLNSPAGVKFVKLSCGDKLLALTDNGDVYEYTSGNPTPVKKVLPRPASDIASGTGFQVAIVPDDINAGPIGWPYGWGYAGTYLAISGNIITPVALKSAWGINTPIKRITASHNNIHFIDANAKLWAMGDNAEGEVGIGIELVNHAETYATPYVWNWLANGYMVSKPVQIATSRNFKEIFTGGSYVFYHYAIADNDDVYSWGRNKAMSLGNGKAINEEAVYPNALDVLTPTLVTPMTMKTAGYAFVPYTINAGSAQTITLPVDSVTMNGSAIPSSGYTIASYKWTKVSGPAGFNIKSPANPKTIINGLSPGVYVFNLQMTDNNTATISGKCTITVLSGTSTANQTPISNAGVDQKKTLPVNLASLDGSASYDPDGTIATYAWSQVSGPSTAGISSAATAKTNVTGLIEGTYQFQLTVTDNKGSTATSTVSVQVLAALPVNQVPVAEAGSNITITLPTSSTTLDGSKSADPDGTIASYAWTMVSGPSTATINNPGTVKPTLTGLVQGQYIFQLKVTDNGSATATDQVTVMVNAATNQSPVADAGPNQGITLPVSSATLNGSASADPDGTISKYSWVMISGPSTATLSSTSIVNPVASGLQAGAYVFELTVTDNSNATAKDQVTITVSAASNQAPVADAGTNKTITLPTSSVSLDGTKSSDPDGTISAYAWTMVSGPSTATINNPSTVNPNVTSLVQGQYIFQLKVTDNAAASSTDQVTIVVNAAVNQLPVANAGPNQGITLPVSSVTLNASASADPDGTISTYSWAMISGPSTASLNSTSAVNPVASGLQAGTYIFELTVTDNSNATAKDQVAITVSSPGNQSPMADAGANKTITLPTSSVSLDGTKSSDPDGTISTYSWAMISGPSTVSIGSSNTATPNVTGLQAGQYVFELTVTDNSSASSKDQVTVTVNSAIPVNQLPIAQAGTNQVITLPTSSVNLDGSSSTDPDGSITTYSWAMISGPSTASISNSGATSPTASGLVVGQYVFELTVTDNNSATNKDQVTITVNAASNQPPIANAGANQVITAPTSLVNLFGTASTDPDGSIISYSWTQISGPSAAIIGNAGNVTTTVTGLQVGQYVFELTVTDNKNATSKDQATVTVNAAGNQAPEANAGANQTITLPTNSVTLDGSASADPDGSIASYSWTMVSGPATATISNSGAAAPTASGLVAGQYVFELTVTDNNSATNKDQVTITVNAASNQPPIANAGANQVITAPTSLVNLFGTSSIDPDGSIISYNWTQISGPSAAIIGNAGNVTTTVTGLQVGQYVFELTVTDNKNATSKDQITITVNSAANQAPTANAGANQTITLPTNSVTLDGTGSSDADGSIATYSWTMVSGPGTPAISNGAAVKPVASGLQAGQYVFQLTVTDNASATSTDQVTIIVYSAVNKLPVAIAGSNQTISWPDNSVSLDGSQSYDPDGTINSYSWTLLSGTSAPSIANAGAAGATANGLLPGQYTFQLTVTDNSNATAIDQVTITVTAPTNQPPVANAGTNQTIAMPANSASLDGTHSFDPDGTIVQYSWTLVTGASAVTIVNAGSAAASVAGLQPGDYTFELAVTDNSNATTKDYVIITVTGTTSAIALVADAGKDTTIAYPANVAILNGSASTGSIASYTWTQISGPGTATINNSGDAVTSVGNLVNGDYVFELSISDGLGNTATSSVTIKSILSEKTDVSAVQVYPNPAHDLVHLRIVSDDMGKLGINLYSISGSLVQSTSTIKNQTIFDGTLNVSNLANGTYVIETIIGPNKRIVAKLIKQ